VANSAASLSPQEVPPQDSATQDPSTENSSRHDAFQVLLAFSALREQVRRKKKQAESNEVDGRIPLAELEKEEHFVLDEVLQLVAERAITITGADGVAIALAENDEIVLRAGAGTVRPGLGARIDRDSAFSGSCFHTAQIARCDDTENDPRVNREACRQLDARSIVAVPLCGRRQVIGLLEAFSVLPYGFDDRDVNTLGLLAELLLGALKPEDEDRLTDSAQMAATKLEATPLPDAAAAIASDTSTPVAGEAAPITAWDIPSAATIPDASVGELDAIRAITNRSRETVAPSACSPSELARLRASGTRQSSGVALLLLCVAVALAFAAGAWWAVRAAQLRSVMARTERTQAKLVAKAVSPSSYEAAGSAALGQTHPVKSSNIIRSSPVDLPGPPATLEALSRFPHITGVEHTSEADSSTVVLNLEDLGSENSGDESKVHYEAHRLTGPDRIYFDVHETQLVPGLAGKSIEVHDAVLKRIRVAQPVAGITRVVLETKTASDFSESLQANPLRLVIEVRATPQPH